MYKMLIVDDESWIRERLRHTIRWIDLGIEVVGEAGDGEEALNLTEELQPDVVLTDIRMPCIDGLEFIKRLREDHNNAKVIIISGFSDFEYAQKAIKLGAFDYILKPVEDNELTDIVKRCIEEIESEKRKEELFEKASRQVKESLPLLKEKFFTNLLNGYFGGSREVLEELEYLGIKHKDFKFICFIVQLDEYDPAGMQKKWDRHLIQFVICNIIQDFLNKLGRSEIFSPQTGEVVCMVFSENNENTLTRQVMSISGGIRKMTKRILGCTVTIGIGRTCDSVLNITASYKEARQALQYKAYLGNDRIYDIRSLDTQYMPRYTRFYDMESLLNSIKMGSREGASKNLAAIINEIEKEYKNIRPIDLKLIYIDVANSIFKIFSEGNSSVEDIPDFGVRFLEQLNRLQSVKETHVLLSTIIERVIEYQEKFKSGKKRKVVEKAVEYIEKHYKEPITLNDVADRFYLNASYFCKVFKEETGESFTRFLMKLRVQKAIEIMSDPTIKIYEVAEKVGYDDVQYFTKVFKSFQGVTPMQYREKVK